MSPLSQYYRHCIDCICTCKAIIAIIVTVFISSSIIGFIYYIALTPIFTPLIQDIKQQALGLNQYQTAWFILSSNMSTALFGLVSGIAFGLIPLAITVVNGLMVGFVLHQTLDLTGSSQWWMLIPHGILELPAIWIALGLGIRIGFTWLCYDTIHTLKTRLTEGLQIFVLVITPLLISAAIIETLVSSLL